MFEVAAHIAFWAIPALTGSVVVAAVTGLREKMSVVLVGTLFGIVATVSVLYATRLSGPPRLSVLYGVLSLEIGLAIFLLATTQAWRTFRQLPLDRGTMLVLVVVAAGAASLAPQLLQDHNGELGTSVLNAWGDAAWHVANITAFAEGQSFPPANPILAGTRLVYPFLTSLHSAWLMAIGASLTESVVMPAFVFMTIAFTLFYSLVQQVTASRTAAIVALVLLIGGGGVLGWTRLPADMAESGSSVGEFLLHLPRDYSGSGGDSDGFHFLNIILSLFLPQRSFLLGIPLALAIVLLLVSGERKQAGTYVVAGVLAGLLPLAHAHTMLVLVPVLAALFLLAPGRQWLFFALPALLVGLPELLFYVTAPMSSMPFFRWGPGWTAGEENVIWYWFKNTGLLLPAALAAWWLPGQKAAKALAGAALVVFVVANTYLFAPWAWDNFKLLIYWLIFSLPAIGVVAAHVLHTRRWQWHVVAMVLIGLHVTTGSIDLIKTALPTATVWGEWDGDAQALAAAIQTKTQPGEIILTAPYHNNPAALAGRAVYLGFPGHVWSHGGDPVPREQAVRAFYEGRIDTLPDLTVQYVVVGPVERQHYPTLVVRPAWKLVARVGNQQLYKIAN